MNNLYNMFFNFKKISQQIFKISMFNNRYIGNCIFSIKKDEAIINNLFINKNFRGQNNGSILLKETENTIKNNFKIKNISLLAYEKPFGNLITFYESNGYTVNALQYNNLYDDGVYIYNLINMTKVI